MRKLLFIMFLGISVFARADAWDNLTHEQAHKVENFLKKNPFIIDWCDCCGSGEAAYLLKVNSTKIVPCTWDKKQYSVVAKATRITRFQVSAQGIDDYHTDPADRKVEYTIYMNYTFAYDHHMKWAVPMHKLIDYSTNGPICFGATNYPDPSDDGVAIKDSDYIDWFAKHITK
jgi:hypothetical protein